MLEALKKTAAVTGMTMEDIADISDLAAAFSEVLEDTRVSAPAQAKAPKGVQ